MKPGSRHSKEQRESWTAFIRELHGSSDSRVVRLMDDFRQVAHRLYQLSEASLESSGLSYAQFRVLMGLRYREWAGNHDGLNPSEISDQQGTSRNTISSLIRSLEEAQLVERHLDETDRRRFNIRLTDTGRQIVFDHAAEHVQLSDELFAALDEDDIETFSRILHTLNRQSDKMKDQHSSPSRR